MDKDTVLGPLTTKKRLDELEALVEKNKKRGCKNTLWRKKTCWF